MNIGYTKALRLFNRNTRLFLVSWALLWFARYGITGVLFNLYLLRLSFGPEFIGQVSSVRMAVFAGASLLAIDLGRRWGMRRVMLAGAILATIALTVAPTADLWAPSRRALVILSAIVFGGLGDAFFFVNCTPYLTAVTGRDTRDHAFSIQWALQPLSMFVGSLVGGVLPGAVTLLLPGISGRLVAYRWSLLASPILLLCLVPIYLAMTDAESEPSSGSAPRAPGSAAAARPLGLIAVLSVVSLLRWAGRGTADTFFNVYLDSHLHVPVAQIGLIKSLAMLIAVPAALTTPFLTHRLGKPRTIILTILCASLSLIPLALVPQWLAAGVGYMAMMAFFTISSSAITVYSQEIVGPAWRTAVSGVTNMAVGVGMAATSLAGGYMVVGPGYTALFLGCGGLILCSMALYAVYFRVPRGEYARWTRS